MSTDLDDSLRSAFEQIVARTPEIGPVPAFGTAAAKHARLQRPVLVAAFVLLALGVGAFALSRTSTQDRVVAVGGPSTTIAVSGDPTPGPSVPGMSENTSSEATAASAASAERITAALDASGWTVDLREHASRVVTPGTTVQWTYFLDGDRRVFVVEAPPGTVETSALTETSDGFAWPDEAGATTVMVRSEDLEVIVRSESFDGSVEPRPAGQLFDLARRVATPPEVDNSAEEAQAYLAPGWLITSGNHGRAAPDGAVSSYYRSNSGAVAIVDVRPSTISFDAPAVRIGAATGWYLDDPNRDGDSHIVVSGVGSLVTILVDGLDRESAIEAAGELFSVPNDQLTWPSLALDDPATGFATAFGGFARVGDPVGVDEGDGWRSWIVEDPSGRSFVMDVFADTDTAEQATIVLRTMGAYLDTSGIWVAPTTDLSVAVIGWTAGDGRFVRLESQDTSVMVDELLLAPAPME